MMAFTGSPGGLNDESDVLRSTLDENQEAEPPKRELIEKWAEVR